MKTTIQQKFMQNYDNLDLLKLPEVIKRHGFEYKLLRRTNHKCLYSQFGNNRVESYEVFYTKIVNHRKNMTRLALRDSSIDPMKYPEFKEVFPSDEEFGKRAWSYPTLELAESAFNSK